MSESEQSGAGRREVAYRLFATEFDDADLSYSESDEERAPNYVITPTGARVNRLFVVGVLTEVEQVSDDVLRGRVADPTGAFVLYAGQYQPDEMAFLEAATPPTFVAVTGKARTFQPDDSDRVFTSIRPESINEVDADTRDRWSVQAAEQTLDRIRWMARALSMDERGDDLRTALGGQGVDAGLASGIPIALDHYGTTPSYLAALRDVAVDAARVVAGRTDEVPALDVSPGDGGETTLADLRGTLPSVDEATAVDTDDRGKSPTGSEKDGAAELDTGADGDSRAERETGSTDPGGATESGPADREEASAPQPTGTTDTESTSPADEPATEEPAGVADSSESTGGDDLGDFDPSEYELEEETREQIEEEYGTEFQTGTEVDEPGSADIDTTPDEGTGKSEADSATDPTPGRDEPVDAGGEDETATGGDSAADEIGTAPESTETAVEAAAADESPDTEEVADGPESEEADDSPEAADDGADEEPDDLQAAVVDLMGELDDGDGADRQALIDEMNDRYGTDEGVVEEAIQGALMDGQCYEPDETTLKPI